jgi:hypothetical protein
MDIRGQASFLPEKFDHNSLLELVNPTLKAAINGFQKGKIDFEGDRELNKDIY